MKERFIQRYKDKVNAYFNYTMTGEGHRAIMYVISEYEAILQDEFGMSHEEVREIYDELYKQHYFKEVVQ